jgi:hypothetical protein
LLSQPPHADAFLASTQALGAIDVRGAGEEGAVFVYVLHTIDEFSLDCVRVIAKRHWPDRPIVIGRRAAHEAPRWDGRRYEESGPVAVGGQKSRAS